MTTRPTPTESTEEGATAPDQTPHSASPPSILRKLRTHRPSPVIISQPTSIARFQSLAWWLIPLLAVVAFAPTLGTWFVSDDFGHLLFHQSLAFPKPLIAFDSASLFYRPLSTALTWNLGYALFGTNAFAYHIFSLLFHALASLFLGRAVSVIAGDKRIGWLSGAIFAVYPLCTEPVAWLASQWDLQGGVCVTGAVWAFAIAWRDRNPRSYALAMLAALLAVGMKESTLPLPLVMPFVAVATTLSARTVDGRLPAMSGKEWWALLKRSVLWSIPFLLPSLLFIGLRWYGAGSLGGYTGLATNYQDFFWDALVTSFLEAVTPLNRLIFSPTFVQLLGALMSGLLLVSLALWGKRRWHLLLLALAWWVAFILPVLNLIPPISLNLALQTNRIFYLSLMGFSLGLATLVAGFLEEPWAMSRKAGWALVGLALVLTIPVTWLQLQPWVHASRQTRHIVDEMHTLIAPLPRMWIDISATHLPVDYNGAYVFRNGLDDAMIGLEGQLTRVNQVARPNPQRLPDAFTDSQGRYDLDFSFDPLTKLFSVSSLAGITAASDPPEGAARLWDFRQCNAKMPDGWHSNNVTTECRGTDIAVRATTTDPSLLFPTLDINLADKKWVRLGVSVRYPTVDDTHIAEWFWQADGDATWDQDRSRSYYLDTTKNQRVYWTFIPIADMGKRLTALRFDPVNDRLNAQLAWISLDVK